MLLCKFLLMLGVCAVPVSSPLKNRVELKKV